MSRVFAITADQPTPLDPLAVEDLTPEEVASLAEELVNYHQPAGAVVLPARTAGMGSSVLARTAHG